MRRWRRLQRGSFVGLTLERLCATVGLNLSPQSSLNTQLWTSRASCFAEEFGKDHIMRLRSEPGMSAVQIATRLGLSFRSVRNEIWKASKGVL